MSHDDEGTRRPIFAPPPRKGASAGSIERSSDLPEPLATEAASEGGEVESAPPTFDDEDRTEPGIEWPSEPPPDNVRPITTARRRAKTSTSAVLVVGEIGVPDADPGEGERQRRGASIRVAASVGGQDPVDPSGGPETPRDPNPGDIDALLATNPDPEPLPAEPGARPPGPSRSNLVYVVLGVIAAAVVAIILLGPGRESDEASELASDAGQPGPDEPAPGSSTSRVRRPDEVRTRAGDPSLRTLREQRGETGDGGSEGETGDEGTDTTTTTTTTTGEPAGDVDPRDPAVIPPGTPDEHAKAFLKLPLSIHDGPPVGGIGPAGIHVDEISIGRGDGDCEGVSRISLTDDDRVSVCFRVVHQREEENVRVYWDKDGVTTRRGTVRIRGIHAYKTRAHLELRPEYAGSWRARILAEGDDTELAAIEFEITE